jgi:DNA-binding MarR family transcriptional regulator
MTRGIASGERGAVSLAPVAPTPHLPFDPIDRAADLWEEHFGAADTMRVATSIMRVQQLLLGALDAQLKQFDITFARYEVLVLLTFSRRGHLPLSTIGERLMVHPTSVTNAIDRLVAQGLVRRQTDPADRRRVLASLTAKGTRVTAAATTALTDIEFGIDGLAADDLAQLYALLRSIRAAAGDFPSD